MSKTCMGKRGAKKMTSSMPATYGKMKKVKGPRLTLQEITRVVPKDTAKK